MNKKYLLAEELAEKMNQNLNDEDDNRDLSEINDSMKYLHSASEILEDLGLNKQSQYVLQIISNVLQDNYVIKKIAKKSKKNDSNKIVKNLLDHEATFDLNENDDYKKWAELLDSKSTADEDLSKLDDNLKNLLLNDKENSLLNLDINDADLEVYENDLDEDLNFEDEI